jgi:DNA-binding transcriptional LysR family regulator
MSPDLRDIEYFAVIAEHRHLGRAAEALGLGQPALSVSLRRLEQAAQAKLVERTPKGVQLTAVGAALLGHVARLRRAREDLTRELADLAHGYAGTLRIGASPSNLLAALPEVCASLLQNAPKLGLSVSALENEALLPALRKGELDVAVGHVQQFRAPDIVEIPLQEDEFVVYCAAAHRLARRRSLTLDALADERWIASVANADAPWLSLRQLFAERGLPAPKIALTSPSSALNLRAVAAAPDVLGIGNRRYVQAAAAELKLVTLPVKDLRWVRRAVIFHRRDAYLSPVAKRFIEAMGAQI